MTESEDKKEAWEHIAGELPPGANEIHMSRREVVFLNERWWGADANAKAWAHWEFHSQVTRRAYAELIAPQRVREAAEVKYGGAFEGYAFGFDADRGHVAMVSHMDDGRLVTSEHEGPDICTAAWAAIQEMKAK